MLERRAPVVRRRAGEPRSTVLFVASVAALAVLLALVPHTVRTTPLQYRADNGTLSMNWFFQRPSVRPVRNADTYGISTQPVAARAGATFRVAAGVRPTGAPGGRVCIALVATNVSSSSPAQRVHECAPLAAGWTRFPPLTLRTAAPSRVYAEITARGNDGGFEARPPADGRIIVP